MSYMGDGGYMHGKGTAKGKAESLGEFNFTEIQVSKNCISKSSRIISLVPIIHSVLKALLFFLNM